MVFPNNLLIEFSRSGALCFGRYYWHKNYDILDIQHRKVQSSRVRSKLLHHLLRSLKGPFIICVLTNILKGILGLKLKSCSTKLTFLSLVIWLLHVMKVLTFKCHFSSGVFFTCGNFGQQLLNFDFLFEFCEKGGKVSKVILISSHLREIKKNHQLS